jgi:hypothetical protein
MTEFYGGNACQINEAQCDAGEFRRVMRESNSFIYLELNVGRVQPDYRHPRLSPKIAKQRKRVDDVASLRSGRLAR